MTRETIDWTRVAKPQPDCYDIDVLRLIEPKWSRAFALNEQPAQAYLGPIAVRPERLDKRYEDMSGDFDTTTDTYTTDYLPFVSQWEDGWRCATAFIDELWAFRTVRLMGKGCMSGHHIINDEWPIHGVYSSLNDQGGFSQGFYHEFAHLRLRALHIGIESQDDYDLLLNPPEELYDSSVRFDKKRPMSAVLHGFYAWLMFMENDAWNHHGGLYTLEDFRIYSHRNIAKLVNGWVEIQNYARWTPEGQLFWRSCSEWTEELVTRVQYLFGETPIPQSQWTYLK